MPEQFASAAMIRLHLVSIKEWSKQRPEGYLDHVLSRGRLDGEWVEWDDDVYRELCNYYRLGPTIPQMLSNFGGAVVRWVRSGFAVVSETQFNERLAACSHCPHWDAAAGLKWGKCNHPKCGCTRIKLWLATENCPISKWE